MSPAAAVDSLSPEWSDEMESNGDFELASSSGNADQGWHKVTNPKKQRLREKKLKSEGSGAGLGQDAKNSSESKAFEALEKEAEARRERRKLRNAAWSAAAVAAAAPAANGVGDHRASDDDDQSEGESKIVANGGGIGEEKKKVKKAKKPKVSIAEAAAAIDTADLAGYLATLSTSYVDEIQLIRCVDYFVRAFSSVNTVENAWDKLASNPLVKNVQIPLEDLPEKVYRTTANWLGNKPVDSLCQFVTWALSDVLLETQSQQKGAKGGPTVSNSTKIAVLVVVAILLKKRSDVLLSMTETLRQTKFQGPAKLYVLAWMYGQVVQEDLLAGVYLWAQHLLPLAAGRTGTPVSRDIALQFFESYVMKDLAKKRSTLLNGATRKERVIVPHALITCLHMAYPSELSRTKATQRFIAIYPTVKEIALGGSSRTRALKSVSHQLLPLAIDVAAEDNQELSREGCDLFRWCLFQSPENYRQWEKLHAERLKGSVRVLKFLRDNWRESESMLSPVKDLRSTVAALRIQSFKMIQEEKSAEESMKALDHCKFLEKKMSSWHGCFKASVSLAFTVGAGYLFYLMSPSKNPWNWDGKLLLRNL